MGLGRIKPIGISLTGNSWHGRFRAILFKPNDPNLIEKYLTLQTFPSEYMIKHISKTRATKYIANAVPPLAIANWLLSRGLLDNLPHRIEVMIDLFAGIGGWALALCYYLRFRINRIIAIDIDRHALELYKLNIRKYCGINVIPITADVMYLQQLPNAELITMSPPCESVSRANIHNKACEPALSLTIKAIQLAKVLNPILTLFEEAPTKGYCRVQMINILKSAGFNVDYVNLMAYGALNKRSRLLAYVNFNSTGFLNNRAPSGLWGKAGAY